MRKNCSFIVLENFFEPCALYLLLKKPSYGYELFYELKRSCSCSVNIGNLYRKLNALAKQEYVAKQKEKGVAGPDKTIYKITEKGKAHLHQWITNLEREQKTISSLITNYKKTHVTPK